MEFEDVYFDSVLTKKWSVMMSVLTCLGNIPAGFAMFWPAVSVIETPFHCASHLHNTTQTHTEVISKRPLKFTLFCVPNWLEISCNKTSAINYVQAF